MATFEKFKLNTHLKNSGKSWHIFVTYCRIFYLSAQANSSKFTSSAKGLVRVRSHVWRRDINDTVDTTCSQKSLVNSIRPIGGRVSDNIFHVKELTTFNLGVFIEICPFSKCVALQSFFIVTMKKRTFQVTVSIRINRI